MVELKPSSFRAVQDAAILHEELEKLRSDIKRVSTEGQEEEMERRARRRHPHSIRRTAILKSHPDISRFMGRNLFTCFYSVALLLGQVILAGIVGAYCSWPVAIAVAYAVGAVIDHALWVLIHDYAHNLVFRHVGMNRFGAIIANISHVIPTASTFRYYHILHHIELNQVSKDPDVPTQLEADIVGNSAVMKALWLSFFWLIQSFRLAVYTYKIPSAKEMSWIVLNVVIGLSADYAIYSLLGGKALVYMLLSSLFSIGLHPLGARWIQEHYPTEPFQTTYSYYGPLNRVAFNIGFHNEHHDFPSVPWNLLPKVRAEAPEYYDTLFSYGSYTRLLLDFVFRPQWSLQDRIQMEKRNFE